MNGPLRGLASCRQDRLGDPSGAVSCAELLELARQKGLTIPMPAALRIASEVLEVLDSSEPRGAAACGLVSPRRPGAASAPKSPTRSTTSAASVTSEAFIAWIRV